jgi:hypothetical protein
MDFGALLGAVFFTGVFFLILFGSIWLGRLRDWLSDRWYERFPPSYKSPPDLPPREPCPHEWARTQSNTWYCIHCGHNAGSWMPRKGRF